jgi:uncharacterized membrane protein YkvA (DUF1232 family)
MTPSPEPPVRPVIRLPVIADTRARQARIVREGFWRKLLVLAGRVPFAEDLGAAWFCVMDRQTPHHVRGAVLLALAWFVVPAAVLPEFLPVLGFTDDAAVVALVARLVRRHIKEHHYVRARQVLGRAVPPTDEEIWG